MNIPHFSIKRPVFITSLFILSMIASVLSFGKLGVDLLPNVSYPIVIAITTYSGAGPREIETLISKPLEDSISIPGVDTIRSINNFGQSIIVIQFNQGVDIKYGEQQVNEAISGAQHLLPIDIDQPSLVKVIDPNDKPIVVFSIAADIGEKSLYDLADKNLRQRIEQVDGVGSIDVLGGRKREIHVNLDRAKLDDRQISPTQIVSAINGIGGNIPGGRMIFNGSDTNLRTIGEFTSVKEILDTVINFYGNENATRLRDVATIEDGLEDELSRSYVNGKSVISMAVYMRPGENSVAVADGIVKALSDTKETFAQGFAGYEYHVIQDASRLIRANIDDVKESIIIGAVLTIITVFFFLGSIRSTLITAVALPNSLMGAFILMHMGGFTINMMTLLAMSLAVGLLIDDAIVVRENIFRHIQDGMEVKKAAECGTAEVLMAVVATTAAILSVFGPVGFLEGTTGQFFKEFAFTVCFIMLISLIDAITMAPMLSAYFASNSNKVFFGQRFFDAVHHASEKFQHGMVGIYSGMLQFTLRRPFLVIFLTAVVVVPSFPLFNLVPKTFISPSDAGEFQVDMDTPAGTDIDTMDAISTEIVDKIRAFPESDIVYLSVGSTNGDYQKASIYANLKKERKRSTAEIKDQVRGILKEYKQLKGFAVKDVNRIAIGGYAMPFVLNIISPNLEDAVMVASNLKDKLVNHPDLKDVDTNYRIGKPELQIEINKEKAKMLGTTVQMIGKDLRTQSEGTIAGVFREKSYEYNIRVRMKEDQRNVGTDFKKVLVPNLNGRLIKLAGIANVNKTNSPATIYRQDRGRYVQITANINTKGGGGMAKAMEDAKRMLTDGTIKMPEGTRFRFYGQAQSMQELYSSIQIAFSLAILFIYLVLASLYESFTMPFLIMLVLPLAACGSIYALLIAHSTFDIFATIGCVMLLGLAAKNSILFVDYANQLIVKGSDHREAILKAGQNRIRPIVMTTVVLIAGMIPVSIGLNEVSSQRTSMGIAVVGGMISSTFLTLVLVPAVWEAVHIIKLWGSKKFKTQKAKIL